MSLEKLCLEVPELSEALKSLPQEQQQLVEQALVAQEARFQGRLGGVLKELADFFLSGGGGLIPSLPGVPGAPAPAPGTPDIANRFLRLLAIAKIIASFTPSPVDDSIVAILTNLLSNPQAPTIIAAISALIESFRNQPAVPAPTPTPAPVQPAPADSGGGFAFPGG